MMSLCNQKIDFRVPDPSLGYITSSSSSYNKQLVPWTNLGRTNTF